MNLFHLTNKKTEDSILKAFSPKTALEHDFYHLELLRAWMSCLYLFCKSLQEVRLIAVGAVIHGKDDDCDKNLELVFDKDEITLFSDRRSFKMCCETIAPYYWLSVDSWKNWYEKEAELCESLSRGEVFEVSIKFFSSETGYTERVRVFMSAELVVP